MKIGMSVTIAIVLLSIGWLIWKGDDAKQAPAVVAAAAVISASIFSAVITQGQIKEREIAETHRLNKISVYEDFSDLYLEVMQVSKHKPNSPQLAKAQQKVVDHMLDFSKRAMLWASPEVLRAYNRFRSIGSPESAKKEIVLRVDDVLQEMRRDLGLGNSGLKRGTLIKLYLSDPENLGE